MCDCFSLACVFSNFFVSHGLGIRFNSLQLVSEPRVRFEWELVEEAGKVSGIEKFDGIDFAYWRMQIEDYLYGRKLHLPLLGTKPESMKVEEWALLDKQVLGVIRLTLFRSVAHNVVKEKTTTNLMKALSRMYKKSSANNKVHLMKKLFNLKMTENASVA